MAAILPTDMIHDSPRVAAYDEDDAEQALRLSVDLAEEERELAAIGLPCTSRTCVAIIAAVFVIAHLKKGTWCSTLSRKDP